MDEMIDWKYAFITELFQTQQCTGNKNTTAVPYFMSYVQQQGNIVMLNIQLCLVHKVCTSCVTDIRWLKFSEAKTGSYVKIQLAHNSSQSGIRTHAGGTVIRLCTPHASSPIIACMVTLRHLKNVTGTIQYFNHMSKLRNNRGDKSYTGKTSYNPQNAIWLPTTVTTNCNLSVRCKNLALDVN